MSTAGQGLPAGGGPQGGGAGAQASINEATETLQQIQQLHLDEPKPPPPGVHDAPVASAPAAGNNLGSGTGTATGSGAGAGIGAGNGSSLDAPPPIAEALAPIADDATPPPPADPVPKNVKDDVSNGSAGFPPAPGVGGSLDRGTTDAAAGGDTVQDDDSGQGGILSTIGSYFGLGSNPDTQDVPPPSDAEVEDSSKGASGQTGTLRTVGTSHAGAAAGAAGAGGAAAGLGAAAASSGSQDGAGGSGAASGAQQQGAQGAAGGGGSGKQQEAGPSAAGSSALAARPSGQPGGYEWLADLLEKMWPYITEAVNKEAANQLPPLIKASKPTWMGDITLHKFKLGGAPPKLTDIRVIKDPGAKGLKGDDYIHLEVDFDWDSSQDVEMDVSIIPEKMKILPNFLSKAISKATSFRCGVENFEMFGDLMIAFRPVMHQLPIIGAVQVSFTEAPDFDFDITMGTAGAKVLDALPMVKNFLYGFIADTLLAPYILPDHYFYPIDPAAPDYSIPVGWVEVEVVAAKKVPKMDYFTSTSPYVQVSTHKRGAKQTKIGSKPRNPEWGETFKLPIMIPRYQHITAVLYDEDYGGDDEVGRVIYPVKDLKPNETQDLWLPVKPLLQQDKDEEENKKARRKRDKLKSALTRPLGPADPQHKGTELHLRMTYRECSEDQVRSVMEAEQKKTTIKDAFMAELLKEEEPTGVVAGDRAQQANPAQAGAQDTEAEKQKKAEQGEPQVVTKDGVQILESRARPGSASASVAATGEVE